MEIFIKFIRRYLNTVLIPFLFFQSDKAFKDMIAQSFFHQFTVFSQGNSLIKTCRKGGDTQFFTLFISQVIEVSLHWFRQYVIIFNTFKTSSKHDSKLQKRIT